MCEIVSIVTRENDHSRNDGASIATEYKFPSNGALRAAMWVVEDIKSFKPSCVAGRRRNAERVVSARRF